MLIAASRLRFMLFLLALVCGPAALVHGQHIHSCTIIPAGKPAAAAGMPSYLPPGARSAVSYKPQQNYDYKWRNGSTVTVRFLGGSSSLRGRVMTYAREWTRFANLNFRVVSSGDADIRISFVQNGASWSTIGNSSTRINQSRPSMNFGWLTDRTSDQEVKRTVLHEFGHALGLLHEHQNPEGGIPWNEEVVYDHYRQTQGWDRQTTYNNVMATANRSTTQYSAYDRASIMHYPVSPQLTGGRYAVGMNKELSPTDRMYIIRMYPGRVRPTTTSSPPARPTTTPTPQRPSTRPADSPSTPVGRKTYNVRINNELGDNQKEETVQLYIGDRRYVIQLDRNGRSRKQIELNLPVGQHAYRVVTSSTYFGYRKVRSRGQVRRQYVEKEIRGGGQGVIAVTGNADLALFGSYDRDRGRMKVYLGERGK
ncbi:MAG: M12 family metallopeptidase [Lewinella sp.]